MFLKTHPILRWLARSVVFGCAVALVLYPWALDAFLWRYLQRQDITTSSREVSYAGWKWNELMFSRDGIEASAVSITIPSLLSLAGLTEERPVVIDNLSIDLTKIQSDASGPGSKPQLGDALMVLFDTLPSVERFSPVIRINQADIALSTNNQLRIRRILWKTSQLTLSGVAYEGELTAEWRERFTIPVVIDLSLGRRGSQGLHFQAALSQSLAIDGILQLEAEGQPKATLHSGWPGGELDMQAEWQGSGWLPAEYRLSVSGSKVPYYLQNPVEAFAPSAKAEIAYSTQTGLFSLNLDGFGFYRDNDSGRKPVPWKLAVTANGDRKTIQIPALKIDLPFLKASLGDSFTFNRGTLVPEKTACFVWDLDLSQGILPGFDGLANGRLCLDPNSSGKSAHFTVSGVATGFQMPPHIWPEPVEQIEFSGKGMIDDTSLQADQIGIAASGLGQLSGNLVWNWQAGVPSPVQVEGRLLPALLSNWIKKEQLALSPKGVNFDFEASHQPSGWQHSGSLVSSSATIGDKLQADVQLQWRGYDRTIEEWSIRLDHDDLVLSGGGSLQLLEKRLELGIHQFKGEQASSITWKLSDPVNLVYAFGDPETSPVLNWSPLRMEFRGGGVLASEGHWSGWSDLAVTGVVENLRLADLKPWIGDSQLLSSSLKRFSFSLNSESSQDGDHVWSGSGNIEGDWISHEKILIEGKGGWFLEHNRIGFDQLNIVLDGTNWFAIDGVLPLGLHGTEEQPFDYHIFENDPLQINCLLEPISEIPGFLQDRLPFGVRDLQASLVASGSLKSPSAEIKANAGTLTWQRPGDETLHAVMDLAVQATVGVNFLRLDRFSLRLPEASDPESIQARVTDIDWIQLVRNASQYPWNNLSGFARIERWPIASLGSLLPADFLPQGHFSVDLSKASGQLPSGNFNFEGLTWRSLDAGIIAREIAGKAYLDGLRLEELKMTAQVGGGEVRIGGWMDFANLRDPHFAIRLQSDRFDLVRRSNLILRGSSDLEAVYGENDPQPLLRGDIELIRSLWLSDLQDFTRQGVAGVSQRPPYFSVKTQPFADWRLDLNIFGQNFLRLQSTLLTGTASTEFKLRGTLGDPLLVGNVLLNDGAIIFPFGSLKTTGIEAWIAEDEPHTIKLSGSGEGVVYGYLVQYHLSGTSEMPAISFTSIPSLAQQDILLMLTTGAVPSAELTANINERTRRLGFFIGQDIFSSLIGQSGASRLEFRTGDGFSPFRREGQLLEYRMNDDWSVIGEYDDFGGYNVDVRRILLQR